MGQNVHHDQASFFFPHINYYYYYYYYFILFSGIEILKVLSNFFPKFFYLLTFTLEKKIKKILNFLVKEMSKICPKKKKTHTLNHHQLFKIMPIVFFI